MIGKRKKKERKPTAKLFALDKKKKKTNKHDKCKGFCVTHKCNE